MDKKLQNDKYNIPVMTDLKRPDEILYATETQVIGKSKTNYFAMMDFDYNPRKEAQEEIVILSSICVCALLFFLLLCFLVKRYRILSFFKLYKRKKQNKFTLDDIFETEIKK